MKKNHGGWYGGGENGETEVHTHVIRPSTRLSLLDPNSLVFVQNFQFFKSIKYLTSSQSWSPPSDRSQSFPGP